MMEKRKKLTGAKYTHRGKLEVRSLWGQDEAYALINSAAMMEYTDLGKYVHDLAAGTLTEMLRKALEEKNAKDKAKGDNAQGADQASRIDESGSEENTASAS